MLIAKRRKLSILLGEVFFAPRIPAQPSRLDGCADCDVLSYIHAKTPAPGAWPVRTLLVDLLLSAETLFAQMSKSTRYKIRRAEQDDGLVATVVTNPCRRDVAEFADFYATFAATKEMRTRKLDQLLRLNERGGLALAKVVDRRNEPICWDSYVVDGERAMRHYFAYDVARFDTSSERTVIGRASRFLIWVAMNHFKADGYRTLDLDTLAGPAGASPLPGMDSYKRGFGGAEVVEYDYRCGRSPIGKLACAAWLALDRLATREEHHPEGELGLQERAGLGGGG